MGENMLERHLNTMEYVHAEANEISISISEVKKNAKITLKDTGWSEEEKERMTISGYDSLDMVRAWYCRQ